MPTPPSQRVRRAILAPLETLVLACLEKEVARRRSDAEQLAERLSPIALGEPWTAEHTHSWWLDHLAEVAEAPHGPLTPFPHDPAPVHRR